MLSGTNTKTHTHTDVPTKAISRNQASTKAARAWFKKNGTKNQPVVKILCQFLEGIVNQRSGMQDVTHNTCAVRFLARSCLNFITCMSLICMIKFVYLWLSWSITQYLFVIPGINVPGNNIQWNITHASSILWYPVTLSVSQLLINCFWIK